jgi:hypothetical protein
MDRKLSRAITLLILGAMIVLADSSAAGADTTTGTEDVLPGCDTNGDGRDDLIVGAPRRNFTDGTADVGLVHEFLATRRRGPRYNGGLFPNPIASLRFGEAISCGDVNGDGYDDIGVGVPFWSGSRDLTGFLYLDYGSADGATRPGGKRSQVFDQASPGIENTPNPGDQFGFSITICDFDGDGYDDVAVGVPGEGRPRTAGAVHVLFGSRRGLTTRDQIIQQGRGGLRDRAEEGDSFGRTLASADLDRDGRCDLIVGVPDEDIGGLTDAGAVHIIYGGRRGLSTRDIFLHRNSPGVPGNATANERYGAPVAFGNFLVDFGLEIVVGVPGEDKGARDTGSVHVLSVNHFDRGAAVLDSQVLDGRGGADAQFGRAVLSGDFDGDRRWDLAVGEPGAQVLQASAAGRVHVIFGNRTRLTNRRNIIDRSFEEDSPPRSGDLFGMSLAGGNFNEGTSTELAAGIPNTDREGFVDAGELYFMWGGRTIGEARSSGSYFMTQPAACDNYGTFSGSIGLRLPDASVSAFCRAPGRSLPWTPDNDPHEFDRAESAPIVSPLPARSSDAGVSTSPIPQPVGPR